MRILVSPLDWGLGHATRCIPIIRALKTMGHEVILGASGAGRRLLQAEFPDLEVLELPSYAMRYSKSRFLLPLWLLMQLPAFLFSMLREKRRLKDLIKTRGIERVIADSRYGLRSREIPCVFITHQLCILPPGPRWLQALCAPLILGLNRFVLQGFCEIWVPDFPGALNLSGKLGHPYDPSPTNPSPTDPSPTKWPQVRYIFPLCRFRPEGLPWNQSVEVPDPSLHLDVLALVSGPEPQRTVFENRVTQALQNLAGTRVLVRGLPGVSGSSEPPASHQVIPGRLNIFDHLPGEQLSRFLEAALEVVCRSGYTSVMELAGMGKRCVLLVPTPGQPEQEYLADHLSAMGFAVSQNQESLNLQEGLRKAAELPSFAMLFPAGEEASQSASSSSPSHVFELADWMREHPLFLVHDAALKRLSGKFVL